MNIWMRGKIGCHWWNFKLSHVRSKKWQLTDFYTRSLVVNQKKSKNWEKWKMKKRKEITTRRQGKNKKINYFCYLYAVVNVISWLRNSFHWCLLTIILFSCKNQALSEQRSILPRSCISKKVGEKQNLKVETSKQSRSEK